MRWFILINGAGVLIASAYAGWAFSEGWNAIWAVGAAVVFFVALLLPFFSEYRRVSSGFSEIEQTYVTARRHERGDGPAVEIFTDRPQPVWKGRALSALPVLLATLLGLGMLGWDVFGFATQPVPEHERRGVISNF